MPNKEYAPEFKAKLALAALCGEKTVKELSEEFGVHNTLIYKWTKHLQESATDVFYEEAEMAVFAKEKDALGINDKTGQLTKEERDFLLNTDE